MGDGNVGRRVVSPTAALSGADANADDGHPGCDRHQSGGDGTESPVEYGHAMNLLGGE